MFSFKNAFAHPVTSIVGLLLFVITTATVLSQQGVTLGTVGTGTVIELIVALATAWLGLVSRDPGKSSDDSGSTSKLGALALIALLLPATFIPVIGCDVSSAQLKASGSALATALSSLSAVLQSSDADTASKLEIASESLSAVVNNWDTSSSAGMLNTAAAGVESVLANISTTSKYASLVAIAVAAVDAILANTASSKKSATLLSTKQATQLMVYRSLGKSAVHHRFGRSPAGDFKAAWNQTITAENLALQPIR